LQTRLNVIQDTINALHAKTYLEIGVEEGVVFYHIRAPKKIAVDPHFLFKGRSLLRKNRFINYLFYGNHEFFFEVTSDEFFRNHKLLFIKEKVNVALVDGLHTYLQAYNDIINVLEILSPEGIILIDDCNPPTEVIGTPVINSINEVWEKAKNGKLAGWTGRWTGDVWKAILRLQSEREDIQIVTLDVDLGMALLMKGENDNKLNFTTKQIEQFTYSDFEKNRSKWLNLKNSDFLDTILQTRKI
jgi:hypothetical protein